MNTILNNITTKIDSYKDEIISFTENLIKISTENPPGNSYKECVKIITDKLENIGLSYNLIEIPTSKHKQSDQLIHCIQIYYGEGKRTLHFHGHYDVVPASSSSQFNPYVKKGNLFGRGSSDMKGGLSLMIFALKTIKELNIPLDGRICLTIVPDEETGGRWGTQYLADNDLLGNSDSIGMLLPEPSSGIIWNANRGAISMNVTIKGKSAHVGLHYKGINAFEMMLRIMPSLQKLKDKVQSKMTDYKIYPDLAKSSILLIGGELNGGSNFNVVPEKCSFTIDRRINPEEDLEEEKDLLLEIFEKMKKKGADIDVNIFQLANASGTNEYDILAKQLVKSTELVSRRTPKFELCPGLLENRFYAEKDIPSFAYGPGLLSVSHGPNEFIKIKDLFDFTAIYALTAIEILKLQKV